ncbi:MAG: serine--tRNA ligase [Candidatus Diapherotrites archaeon CG08_land_8_20_14_0_20_30_16]|nr:MAG: serine--tRNA ligase [Candidatus Diapherotrites archaeon CG08_land_8_20_14_0_20_30_16]
MLDIALFRNDKDFKKLLESEKNRFRETKNAEETKKYDELWKKAKQTCEEKKAEKNKITKEIAELAKNKKPIDQLKEKSKKIDTEIKDLEQKQIEYLKSRDKYRSEVGNILWHNTTIGQGEENNHLIKCCGKAKVQKSHIKQFKTLSGGKMQFEELKFNPKSHVDIGLEKDLFDLERAAKISGSRFYFLKNKLAILHLSILRFAIDKLMKKGFNFMYTPFIVNKDTIEKTAELSDFEEMLYKVGNDQFLIATAEQTLAGFHMDELIPKDSLPLKYVGLSSCFRREAGSHTKDTRGIFRVHQFDKVEQYIFCLPEDSEKIHNEMIKNEEEIIQELELPYRLMDICSSDLNLTAAKKNDLEAWMPVQGTFRELGSGSITTDYQTRNLNIKYEDKNEKFVVHSLNCTILASPRILTAIIENHQTKEGKINIPKALWLYTGFKEI